MDQLEFADVKAVTRSPISFDTYSYSLNGSEFISERMRDSAFEFPRNQICIRGCAFPVSHSSRESHNSRNINFVSTYLTLSSHLKPELTQIAFGASIPETNQLVDISHLDKYMTRTRLIWIVSIPRRFWGRCDFRFLKEVILPDWTNSNALMAVTSESRALFRLMGETIQGKTDSTEFGRD
jgi:hypothetical protein